VLDFDWFPHPLIISALLKSLASDLETMQEPLERMREYASSIMPRNIDDQGGGAWPPLSEGTLERRDGDGGMLIASGTLYDSVGDEGLWALGDGELVLGSIPSPHYAMMHISGTTNMPARDYAYFLPQDTDECERIAWEWLDEVTSII
jgi:hypothetical protein